MVLEQHVVLMRTSTNSTKDVAVHELIHIRPKSVDNIMVIPHIDLAIMACQRVLEAKVRVSR